VGNCNPHAVPHGVYRCKGEDSYCTIAVFTDEQWVKFCEITGKSEWINDDRFSSLENRKKNEQLIDDFTAEWAACSTAEEVMNRLQGEGIPSGIVKNAAGVYEDPQLRGRNLFWEIPHSEIGSFTHLGTSFELSQTPGQPYMASPLMGEHTEHVCTEFLGLSDDEFIGLLQDGLFE
jgi:benzylsuccinate CoA-transferase BbsF subunit